MADYSEAHVQLRQFLGEQIPEGGSDKDTDFRDQEIEDLLTNNGGSARRAAYDGWRIKAARYAELVDVTEGNASRKMSQLHKQALDTARTFLRSTNTAVEGRSRIGTIRRPRG